MPLKYQVMSFFEGHPAVSTGGLNCINMEEAAQCLGCKVEDIQTLYPSEKAIYEELKVFRNDEIGVFRDKLIDTFTEELGGLTSRDYAFILLVSASYALFQSAPVCSLFRQRYIAEHLQDPDADYPISRASIFSSGKPILDAMTAAFAKDFGQDNALRAFMLGYMSCGRPVIEIERKVNEAVAQGATREKIAGDVIDQFTDLACFIVNGLSMFNNDSVCLDKYDCSGAKRLYQRAWEEHSPAPWPVLNTNYQVVATTSEI